MANPSTAGAMPVENTMAALSAERTRPRCAAPYSLISRPEAISSCAPMTSPPPTISTQIVIFPPMVSAISIAMARVTQVGQHALAAR